MPQTPRCICCNGTGMGDVIDHGFAQHGQEALEPTPCRNCGGSGYAWPPKPAVAQSFTDMPYSARMAKADAMKQAILSASKDLVDATYEDKPEHIKQFIHYALRKLGDAINEVAT